MQGVNSIWLPGIDVSTATAIQCGLDGVAGKVMAGGSGQRGAASEHDAQTVRGSPGQNVTDGENVGLCHGREE